MTKVVHTFKALVAITAVFLSLAASAFAQSETGTVSGTVRDTTGAVITDAQVELKNLDQGTATTARTNTDGIYVFSNVKPGRYQVTVQKENFKQITLPELVVNIQARVDQDFRMEIGVKSETITVRESSGLMNTQDAGVGAVVDQQFVENMPLNGRSFQALIELVPGVTATPGAGQFSINGERSDSNYFTVDGVSVNAGVATGNATSNAIGPSGAGAGVAVSANGGYNNLVSIDDLQEFRIQTSTFAPENGRYPGGQVALLTRSGTNAFHGDLFDYLRNTVFDANDWFSNVRHLPRSTERQNDFGGVFGGPVLKDKLFFFASYEGLRLVQPSPLTLTVPSTAACTSASTSGYIGARATAATNNASFTPLANAWESIGLLTNKSNPNLCTFATPYSAKFNLGNASLRVDYVLNRKMTFFIRGNYAPSNNTGGHLSSTTQAVLSGPWGYDIIANTKTLILGNTYTINSALSNDVRFNYLFSTGYEDYVPDSFGGATPPPATVFPPGFSPATSLLILRVTGIGSIFYGASSLNQQQQYNITDALSWSKASHQVKVGVDFRRLTPTLRPAASVQTFLMDINGTVKGAATSTTAQNGFLTGSVDVRYIAQSLITQQYSFHNLGLYAQDTWKLLPRLTVTYGLRWDYNPGPGIISGVTPFAVNQINPANLSATTVLPQGSQPYKPEYTAFAPRVGVAYQLSKDPKWGRVIRAGFGVFYDAAGDAGAFLQSPNIGTFTQVLSGKGGSPAPYGRYGTGTGQINAQNPPTNTAPPFQQFQTVDPNLRLPYSYQTSVALEQSLGSKQSLTATYVGSFGRQLFRNNAYPVTDAVIQVGFFGLGNQSSSDYNALQLYYQRRLLHGLQVMGSYTWAHSIDNASNVSLAYPSTALEPLNDYRGSSDFDVRHAFNTAISYDLPTRGNPVEQAVFGHWGTDILFRAHTGTPIGIYDINNNGFSFFSNFGGSNVFPDFNPNQPAFVTGSTCATQYGAFLGLSGVSSVPCPGGKALNSAAFSTPPVDSNDFVTRNGNLGRNKIRDFSENELDVTLRRDFPVRERIVLQFRADFFNVLNHPNFSFNSGTSALSGIPGIGFGFAQAMLNNTFGGALNQAFGSVYQVGGPRSMQFSLKLKF